MKSFKENNLNEMVVKIMRLKPLMVESCGEKPVKGDDNGLGGCLDEVLGVH